MPITVIDGQIEFDPGRLTKRIMFLNPISAEGSAGTEQRWAPASPAEFTWAEIAPFRGATLIQGGLDVTQTLATITIRYRPGFVPNRRIQAPGGSMFHVQGVQNVLERNEWFELTCLGLGANT